MQPNNLIEQTMSTASRFHRLANLFSTLGFVSFKCLQQTLNYLCFLIVFYAVVKVLASLKRPAFYDVYSHPLDADCFRSL